MEKFTQLHLHTCYSIQDALNTPAQMIEQAVKHGHQACAITDHGTMAGLFNFQQAALKAGVKPLLGMEAYVVDKLVNEDDKGKRIRMKNNHMILLAKNKEGWQSLLKLNYLSNLDENHFYYKPRITFKELFENKEGLIVSSACLASPFSNLLKLGKEKEAEELFQRFCLEFNENFFAELQLNEIPEQKEYNSWLISQATHNGIPLIITGDCHYALPDGAAAQELMFQIRKDDENEVGQTFACRHLYYHGIEDYKNFNKDWNYDYSDEQINEWLTNTTYVTDKINFLIPERTKMLLPRQAFDEDEALTQKAIAGLCEYFGVKELKDCPKEYVDRLLYELRLLTKKGTARYFLVLEDIIKWCDANKISHGPGRGSACGSLVAMCLGITSKAIEPIKNQLIFERFVSEDRLIDCYIDYSKDGNDT